MPADFRIFLAYKLIVTRYWGVVTTEEFTGVYDEITSSPIFNIDQVEAVDFTGVTDLRLQTPEMRGFASRVGERYRETPVRTAMIADSDATFGLARVYQAFAELAGGEAVKVFRERSPAFKWLGLPDLPETFLNSWPPRLPEDAC